MLSHECFTQYGRLRFKVLMVWLHNWLESAQLSKSPHMSPHSSSHANASALHSGNYSPPTQAHKSRCNSNKNLKVQCKAAQGTEHRLNPISIQLKLCGWSRTNIYSHRIDNISCFEFPQVPGPDCPKDYTGLKVLAPPSPVGSYVYTCTIPGTVSSVYYLSTI